MKKINLITLSLGWFLTHSSFGDIFRYELQGLPKDTGTCFQQAQKVAEHFEDKTQVKVTHVECMKDNGSSFDFNIEYEAATELKFTSTDYRWTSTFKRGRYDDQKTCNEQLPKQIEIFEKATQVKPVFSYCRDEGYGYRRWAMIITGVGTSELEPRIGGYIFFTKPNNITYAELFNGLKRVLESQGAILSDFVFQGSSLIGEATVHYFSKDKINFSLERIAKSYKIETCQTQADEVKTWFKDISNVNFTVYCGGPEFGRYELNIGFTGSIPFSAKTSVDTFNTLEECEIQKPQVIAHHSGSSTKNLLGGICSLTEEGKKYNVVIITTPKN